MKVYFEGGEGIKDPVDMVGEVIKEGDELTWNYGDLKHYEIKDWMLKPIFRVKKCGDTDILCGIGINKDLYLHDFHFKNTKKI